MIAVIKHDHEFAAKKRNVRDERYNAADVMKQEGDFSQFSGSVKGRNPTSSFL